MAIVTRSGGVGGAGSGSTTLVTPKDYLEIDSETKQLEKEDQYVIITSETGLSTVTFPPTPDVEDGHYVILARGAGSFSQLVKSDDAAVSSRPIVVREAEISLPLNGDIFDTSVNSVPFTQSADTGFVTDTFLGQTHEVFEVNAGTTGAKGLTSTNPLTTGTSPRTVYFQFKYNDTGVPADKSGFFGIGDISGTGTLFALETDGALGGLRIHIKNALIPYDPVNFPNIFDGNEHTIAVTSGTNSLFSVELYIDDMTTPITKSAVIGAGALNTASTGLTVGYSRSADQCITGKYSNFNVYNTVLSSDDLNILKAGGVLGASDLTVLDLYEEVRFIYDQGRNTWQAIDATLKRLLEYSNRITEVESVTTELVSNGIADYNDTATAITPITLNADTWTTVTNDGLGGFTNTTYLPTRVTRLMNGVGQFVFDELDLGDQCFIRNDFTVTPSSNNAVLSLRYVLGAGADEYFLETLIGRLDNGSGVPYRFSLSNDLIYMGDVNTRDNPITLQVKISTGGTLVNAGSAIGVVKRG